MITAGTFPVIFAAPSGAGKTTIARRLGERREDVVFSISATTRPPRKYERNGVDYHFVDRDEFRRLIEAGELLEWAEVHGNYYGTPRANLREARDAGKYLILDIDIQGSRQVRRAVDDAVSIFVLPPSGAELTRRLASRDSESVDVQVRRLRAARDELAAATEFDYVLVNDNLEQTVAAVDAILLSESLRVARFAELTNDVSRLVEEVNERLADLSRDATQGTLPEDLIP